MNDDVRRAVTWLLNDCGVSARDMIDRYGEHAIDVLIDEFSLWLDELRNQRRIEE